MQVVLMVASFEFEEGMNYGRYSFHEKPFEKEEMMGLKDACEEMEDYEMISNKKRCYVGFVFGENGSRVE